MKTYVELNFIKKPGGTTMTREIRKELNQQPDFTGTEKEMKRLKYMTGISMKIMRY